MVRSEFNAIASGFPEPFRLLVKESVGSTNDEIRKLATVGARDGLIVLTQEQTAGRGRRGAAWFAPAGESLAFSILVRPSEPSALWPRLALAAGISVAEAIESFGITAGIKWPNDIWVGQLKISGILVESGPGFAVVGIGLNVNTHQFPDEVSEIATSMTIATGRPVPRAEVLGAIISRFAIRRTQIGEGFSDLVRSLNERCVLSGRRVSLTTAGGTRVGTVEGISQSGELLLRTDNGVERLIQADDVRLLNE